MSVLQPVRGTHDLLPDEKRRHLRVEETARALAVRYGYAEMSTPIFEFTEVFRKSLGDTSDIVTKEMYTFVDKGGDSVTLRPEFTAGVARAILSHGLVHQLPVKVFCRGPMFRYERPQKGRLRQFHQVDVEIFGVAEALADVEVIALGAHLLDELGLGDKVTLELNTLGDAESRRAYRDALLGFLADNRGRLSEESLDRLARNPLRIFDSKDAGDRAVMAGAPLLKDHLNDASKAFFDGLVDGLRAAGIGYVVNPRLVRGLDYYCHTAFEFTTTELGAQGAVIAGGRYDGLIEQMGGARVPGTGWAAGVERLALLAEAPQPMPRPLAVIAIGEGQSRAALALAQRLRHRGFTVELAFSGSLKKRMKQADRAGAGVALLIGEDELARGVVTVRDMETGAQTAVAEPQLESHLARWK